MWDRNKLLQFAITALVIFAVVLFVVLIIVGHTNSFNFFYSQLINEGPFVLSHHTMNVT